MVRAEDLEVWIQIEEPCGFDVVGVDGWGGGEYERFNFFVAEVEIESGFLLDYVFERGKCATVGVEVLWTPFDGGRITVERVELCGFEAELVRREVDEEVIELKPYVVRDAVGLCRRGGVRSVEDHITVAVSDSPCSETGNEGRWDAEAIQELLADRGMDEAVGTEV